jgi:arabinan endo-1,5-alpha-L-arabinosidase
MIVGRSKNIQGPYLDKEGKSMRTGGGTILMSGDKDWNGLGHNAVLRSGKDDYLVFHAYDAADKGRSKLRIYKLKWNNGWPEPSVPVY